MEQGREIEYKWMKRIWVAIALLAFAEFSMFILVLLLIVAVVY